MTTFLHTKERQRRLMTEKQIENSILSFLALRRVFAFKVDTIGIFDPTKKVYRKKQSVHHTKGISDILGIYRGQPLAIEVKSEQGRVSPEQKAFLESWNEQGGIGFVARSIEDVAEKLGIKI